MSDVQPTNFDPEDMTDLYTLYKSDPEFVKVLKQNANNEFLKTNGGGGVEPAAAPEIVIDDPVDAVNIQAAFDALILALKAAGVLT